MSYYNGHKIGALVKPALNIDPNLKTIVLDRTGTYLASDDGVDGYSGFEVVAPPLPTGTEDYIAGSQSVFEIDVPSSVTRVRGNFQAFPYLESFIIEYNVAMIEIDSNAFTGTLIQSGIGKIYVPDILLSEYQAEYNTRLGLPWVFAGYESYVTWTIPYVGESTLTADYIGYCLRRTQPAAYASNVIVPKEFTTYETGSISYLFDHMVNLENITTQNAYGDMSIDLNGAIASKVASLGFDLADVIEKEMSATEDNVSYQGRSNLVLLNPCVKSGKRASGSTGRFGYFYNSDNIVAIYNLIMTEWTGLNANGVSDNQNTLFRYMSNCLYLKATFKQNILDAGWIFIANPFASGCAIDITFEQGVSESTSITLPNTISSAFMRNATCDITLSQEWTHQALIDLVNSVGTPTTTKTLNLGATNSAKFTSDDVTDIQALYDKNWTISPTPSSFTLTLNGANYQCDFGMTWAQWVSSNYNVDSYQIVDGLVYDPTGTYLVIESNGSIAMSGKLVRGGATYTLGTMPTLSSVTIPYSGNTTLTKSAVKAYAESLADVLEVGKVIVTNLFTDYEAGAFDEIFKDFPNVMEIQSPWLNGTIAGMSYDIPVNSNYTLTSDYVTTKAQSIGTKTLAYVHKVVVPSSFTSGDSAAFSAISSAFSNVTEVKVGIVSTSLADGCFDVYANTNVRYLTMNIQGASAKVPLNSLETDTYIDASSQSEYGGWNGTSSSPIAYSIYAKYTSPSWTGKVYINVQGKDMVAMFGGTGYDTQYSRHFQCTEVIIQGTPTNTNGWPTHSGGYGGLFTKSFGTNEYGTPLNIVRFVGWNTINVTTIDGLFAKGIAGGTSSVSYVYFDSSADFSGLTSTTLDSRRRTVKHIVLPNLIKSIVLDIRGTRDDVLDFINSLGTPSTTQTATIGSTAMSNITNADIQLAYDKNWALSPTPSAFSFAIGSDTYSCDFGSTWATWVASAYNTDGFTVSNNKVYDANNQAVQKNGVDVADTDMVRYGDTYTLAGGVTTISFTIEGTPYTADSGMTWAQWVSSAYNTDGFTAPSDKVYSDGGTHTVQYNGSDVAPTDTITATAYTLAPYSGSN